MTNVNHTITVAEQCLRSDVGSNEEKVLVPLWVLLRLIEIASDVDLADSSVRERDDVE